MQEVAAAAASSEQQAASVPAESVAMPAAASLPPSSASVTPQTASPSLLAGSVDLDAYVRLSCLSLTDFPPQATATGEDESEQPYADSASESDSAAAAAAAEAGLPPLPSLLHSLVSDDLSHSQSAYPAVSVLSPIHESYLSPSPSESAATAASVSAGSCAAAAASPTSSSSLSSDSALSSSAVDLLSDVRFPSLPAASPAEREAKLDLLQARGFSNRVFAATLLELNKGDVELTAEQLASFYQK